MQGISEPFSLTHAGQAAVIPCCQASYPWRRPRSILHKDPHGAFSSLVMTSPFVRVRSSTYRKMEVFPSPENLPPLRYELSSLSGSGRRIPERTVLSAETATTAKHLLPHPPLRKNMIPQPVRLHCSAIPVSPVNEAAVPSAIPHCSRCAEPR